MRDLTPAELLAVELKKRGRRWGERNAVVLEQTRQELDKVMRRSLDSGSVAAHELPPPRQLVITCRRPAR